MLIVEVKIPDMHDMTIMKFFILIYLWWAEVEGQSIRGSRGFYTCLAWEPWGSMDTLETYKGNQHEQNLEHEEMVVNTVS